MIRFLSAYFPRRTFVLGILEVCLVSFAFVAATVARLGANDASLMLSYQNGTVKILVQSAVFITCMYYFDLYDSSVLGNRREVVIRLVQVLITVYGLSVLVYYVYPRLELGRGIFAIGLVLVGVLLLLARELFMMINRRADFAARALILGDSQLGESLVRELGARPELGMNVVGNLKHSENGHGSSAPSSNEGRVEALLSSVKFYEPDHIIVALGDRRGHLPVDALLQLKSQGVNIHDGAELYEAVTGRVSIESLNLSSLLFTSRFGVSRRLAIYKRVFSFVLSLVAIILTLPVMALIALAVFLDSGGPVIFEQERVGQDGRTFTLRKFRTMVIGSEGDNSPRPTELADYRFTRIGGALRRTRMDELPQLFNILVGDMHFIGPRPFVPNQERECSELIPHYRQRWAVKPGVTGWAQVNRGYNVTLEDNKEKLAYDLFYIKNQSVGLDLLILFKTMKVLLLGRGSR